MQKQFAADIFGSQHLFEIYHTSLNIKNGASAVKSRCLGRLLQKVPIFSLKNERY